MQARSYLYIILGIAAALIVIAVIALSGLLNGFNDTNGPVKVASFEECVAAGFPVMESYPRQCRIAEGVVFTEDVDSTGSPQVGNAPEKADLIRVTSPRPNEVIASPLRITGEARGYWYFEASFPVRILDGNGNEIATDPPYIMTSNEWMTENFVPFDVVITFTPPATERGILVFHKDNPSGLPEYDDSLRIPIRFR